jgi:hypothetical protein
VDEWIHKFVETVEEVVKTIVSDQNELSTGPSGSSSGHIGEYDGCIDCRRQQKKS